MNPAAPDQPPAEPPAAEPDLPSASASADSDLPAADDGWSMPSIFGRAMVAGPHLHGDADPIGGLTAMAADWPVERWRAEAAAIEAAEDAALRAAADAGQAADSGRPPTVITGPLPPPVLGEPGGQPRPITDFAAGGWSLTELHQAQPAQTAQTAPPPTPLAPEQPAPERPAADPFGADTPAPEPHRPLWSPTTYVGPARYLPSPAPPPAPAAPRREATAEDAGSTRSVLASSRTMAIASVASRLTGFLRSLALAYALGVGLVADAYNGANSFPNSVYELLLGGVLSSVLIPLIVHAGEHDDDGGTAYTQRLLSIATSVLAVTTLAAVALAPYLADLFVAHGAQRDLTSTFATLLLPEIFFYGLGAMYTAVLNTRHVYGPGAWAPVANNAITLVTIVIFVALPGPKTLTPSNMTTTQVLVLGVGTTLGIVAQALVLVPSLRKVGFRWMWRFRGRPNEAGRLREAGRLSGWVLGYVVVSQIGVLAVTKVAFTLGHKYGHGVSTFTYADLLFQVPFGILGVSLLTAIMPRMARAAARNDTAAVIADVSLGSRLSTLALLPITAGLIVLAPAFTTVLFAHGQTKIADARLIGVALAWSAFGLVPFAFVMLQLRVFYALREGRTPTLINVFMVATKVALVVLAEANLHGDAAVIALNVSTSASYLVGAVAGQILLRRRLGPLGQRPVLITIGQTALACAVGAGAAYGVLTACVGAFGSGRGGALAGVLAGSLVGLAVMSVVALLIGIPEARQVAERLRSRESGRPR